MSNVTLGITPDLTAYSNTTKLLVDKWSKVAANIDENWQVIKDDYGEVVDAIPEWIVTFKDGSKLTVELDGIPNKPEVGIFDCKSVCQRDTQNIINKHASILKNVNIEYMVVKNDFDEKAAILPRRNFVFKTVDDIVESLSHIPNVNNNGGK